MTVLAAEQGAAAATAGGAEASAGASQAVHSAPRQPARAPQPGRQGPAGRQGAPGPPGRQGGSQRQGKPSASQQYLQDQGERAKRRAKSASERGGKAPDLMSYQSVILAEFVAAVLLVAATPFAKKDQPGVSPYEGSDLLQLVALTLTYFILALISGANRGAGRFAAWFGALILLSVGLVEAARLAKLLNVFGLASPAPASGSTGTSQAPGTTTAGGRG